MWLTGFKINKDTKEVRYALTEFNYEGPACGYRYIPTSEIETKCLDQDKIDQIIKLLGRINWSVTPVGDTKNLKIERCKYETYYGLKIEEDYFTSHHHGPNGIGSQYDSRWREISDLILND